MKTTLARMGMGFGSLPIKIRGVTRYHVSPMEQRAFAGAISHNLPNVLWRIRSNIFYIAPPYIIGYMIYTWGEAEHDRLQRKQPGEFDHET